MLCFLGFFLSFFLSFAHFSFILEDFSWVVIECVFYQQKIFGIVYKTLTHQSSFNRQFCVNLIGCRTPVSQL